MDAFAREWRSHVVPVAGIESLLRALSGRFRLAIVSNTNDPAMVPAFLAELGVDDLFESVVLSVDHGFRKPHHSIYQAALDALDLASTDVAFVGDSFVADYAAPRELGMTAYLIDPADRHEVPRGARLQSVLDLGSRLL